jgi:hypothetical protein
LRLADPAFIPVHERADRQPSLKLRVTLAEDLLLKLLHPFSVDFLWAGQVTQIGALEAHLKDSRNRR